MACRLRPWLSLVSALALATAVAPALADPSAPASSGSAQAPLTASPAQAPLTASPAQAPAAPTPQERFDAAQKLVDQGKHAEALQVFREVYAATKSPNARMMVSHCLVALGRIAEAYDELTATMREAGMRSESEPKYAPTRDAAATEIARLELKVGKLIVALADPARAEVTLNGARLSPERLGVPIAVNPGAAVVTAKKPGSEAVQLTARVGAGQTRTVTVVFRDEAEDPAEASGSGSGPAAPAMSGGFVGRGGVRSLGFVATGIGIAGMVVFGVAGAMVQDRLSTLEEGCGDAPCTDPKYLPVIDSGRTLTTVTNAGLAVGIAGLASGAAMIALGGPRSASKSSAPGVKKAGARVSIEVSPFGAGAALRGSF